MKKILFLMVSITVVNTSRLYSMDQLSTYLRKITIDTKAEKYPHIEKLQIEVDKLYVALQQSENRSVELRQSENRSVELQQSEKRSDELKLLIKITTLEKWNAQLREALKLFMPDQNLSSSTNVSDSQGNSDI
jgi:hypothetical protein